MGLFWWGYQECLFHKLFIDNFCRYWTFCEIRKQTCKTSSHKEYNVYVIKTYNSLKKKNKNKEQCDVGFFLTIVSLCCLPHFTYFFTVSFHILSFNHSFKKYLLGVVTTSLCYGSENTMVK